MFGSARPIVVKRNHSLQISELRDRVENIARELEESLQIRYSWDGDQLKFDRLGAHGHIKLDGQEVEIKLVRNPFLPVSDSWLENKINSYLDQHIN